MLFLAILPPRIATNSKRKRGGKGTKRDEEEMIGGREEEAEERRGDARNFSAGPEKRVPFFPALPVIDVRRGRERDIIIP